MVSLSFTALVDKISDIKLFIPGHTHRVDHNVKVYDGIFYHSYDPLNPQVREKLDMSVRATFQNTHVWMHDLVYYYDPFNSISVILGQQRNGSAHIEHRLQKIHDLDKTSIQNY